MLPLLLLMMPMLLLVLLLHGMCKRDRDERQPIEGEVFWLLHQLLLLSAPLLMLCGCVCERERKSIGKERERRCSCFYCSCCCSSSSCFAATAVDVADPRERYLKGNENKSKRGRESVKRGERIVAAAPPNPIRNAFAAISDDVCVGES
jgi:hypothetical protein